MKTPPSGLLLGGAAVFRENTLSGFSPDADHSIAIPSCHEMMMYFS
jgi:hypothetical protein